jgi:phosphoribosylformylglycinamidine synthase
MHNKTIILQGDSAISSFRLKNLNEELTAENLSILSMTNIYVVSLIEEGDLAQLEKLLNAKKIQLSGEVSNCYVAPRVGTISPWSSKATDILKNCGFESINRIEHAKKIEFIKTTGSGDASLEKLYDRMMEFPYESLKDLSQLFEEHSPKELSRIAIVESSTNLDEADAKLGLALSELEKEYLIKSYKGINKEPTDTELMMFAQANSEHCRHKIFNAKWTIDGIEKPKSLFSMIRNTEQNTPKPAVSAYKDNSAVFKGGPSTRWVVDENNQYVQLANEADILIKVETHNHPTAISPFPGAATGSGGEIRDEAATGQGSRPKAGLTGFSVSHLKIPNHLQPWEEGNIGKPDRISSSLEIMVEAPLGGAAFNNEFGRPNICGYFRSLEINTEDYGCRGYHKPIMLAGGLGTINRELAIKQDTQVDDYLVVLGGPAMLIGLGGGAASSMNSGSSCENLDFASVQRGNPEMERRCQEVIDSCWTQSANSPIRSIHDVGAGGLSNAMPELLDDAGLGGVLELRNLQIDTRSMSPMEVWCNESQERYVLSIKPKKINEFKAICQRERCPYAVLGKATKEQNLIVTDNYFKNKPVDIPMDLLFGNTPKTFKNIIKQPPLLSAFDATGIELKDAVQKVLNFPTVASKKYLITIGDRTVSGLVHRDQMVGPWQVPVADCGVTIRDFDSFSGEAMSIGEKAPLALINGAASARMAVCESITNIAANAIGSLSNLKLSANWMAASGHGREDEVMYEAVHAIGEELCPALGIGIPVGKDSLSMRTQWQDNGDKQVTSPVSCLISAFTNIKDINKSLTPYFDGATTHKLFYIDLAEGKKRLGASSLAQVYQQLGDEVPDLDNVNNMLEFWQIIQQSVSQKIISAYHDISDGGLFVSVLEMCMASQVGVEINLDFSHQTSLEVLFAEELGAVVAVDEKNIEQFNQLVASFDLGKHVHLLGQSYANKKIEVKHGGNIVFADSLVNLQKQWSQTSHWMASIRDNPQTCDEEFALISSEDKGLSPKVAFAFDSTVNAPYVNLTKPKVAILREQGVNGQKEMAMAFAQAGFESYDVHMQDLLEGKVNLMDFQGLAACGGFSYGDVLGAGKGWANSILFHQEIKQQFADYFAETSRFALGVCNGCQMMSSLKDIIPGAEHWPQFLRNTSEQFEARFSSLKIGDSNSIFFKGMQGAIIPVAIAHGEGRAVFASGAHDLHLKRVASYVDNSGDATQSYPFNPNGSQQATAAVTNKTGNVMIMMPHPERVFRAVQMSWYPQEWKKNSPWMRMFYNARSFVK